MDNTYRDQTVNIYTDIEFFYADNWSCFILFHLEILISAEQFPEH